jgi:hypothetical protein
MARTQEEKICSICQRSFAAWGNNAQPVNDGVCCDTCDREVVIPARIVMMMRDRAKPKVKA